MNTVTKLKTVLHQNKEVILLRLTNSTGAYIEVTNYGATITAIVVPDKDGNYANIVLHYDSLEEYFTDPYYIGCTIGRYANRISNAQFTLDKNTYSLDKNDGIHSIHGGFSGLNKKVFDYKIWKEKIVFSLFSPHGEGGFPGNLNINVIYSFSNENVLNIEYKSISDKKTPINLTNHTYFNLAATKAPCLNCELQIDALMYLEMNDGFLPTGSILETTDSAFDFNHFKVIEDTIYPKKDAMKGYNTFFLQNKKTPKPIASLREKKSGRTLDVYTSMPGVLLYTGGYLSIPFIPFSGICFEAQYHPDGLNYPHFDTCILEPDVERNDIIEYKFG
ncbi:aldose epimerase family protein [uncultured Dysgonomonas sp.]|uniref:Aldose 1-epimerase n=1 Tax=uncultured Dysgonomonas sp. TaxID=206096 RepID=A0A212JW72_9BACT|nr:aldose epimerase family protein [uncultured Dysgonomonas sp.]SBW03647.1 Aldose 1-epimerase [uncultured Dysgonomonas sp.]